MPSRALCILQTFSSVKLYPILGGWKQTPRDVIELHTHMLADQILEAPPGKTISARP